ncbi:hypothetical protein B0J13DRAFT_619340 [Dactylonectria estremocensis]|uniref:Uncharacterized protein n=1 Tax=Dactylonectria estremocensis TaxID=1079267 RepID=A0A9P9F1G1_9HYPO|nr:hypothetical protein B0J13DRAFT_619340 [Dactylonectria estremocensis]
MSQPEGAPKEDKAPPYGGEQPPSYNEVIKQQRPLSQRPPPSPSQPSSSSASAGPRQTPRQFPPSFNLYTGSFGSSSFVLGEHQNQPLYVFSWHSGLSGKPPVLLHSGPSESFPPLAAAEWRSFSASFQVELPPVPGSGARSAREDIVWSCPQGMGPGAYRFAVEIGPGAVREAFEWRHSRGDAVNSLGGESNGYKLVRLARGPPGSGGATTGGMNFVGGGFVDSAGNEVVAAWVMSRGSITKAAKFQFMGTGLTGLLGERWAIMAVVTFLALFQRVRRSRN